MAGLEKKNIVGHGDIASVLPVQDRLLFFASGVSNSQERREEEYQREVALLLAQDRDAHLVYFSSLSVFYNQNRYTQHKLFMEDLVKREFERHTIFRIGNITWGNNPHTFINFFRNRLEARQPIDILDEYRYIVDKEEFLHWIDLIPDFSCEMNVPGRRMKVQEVVDEYCLVGLKQNGQLKIHTR